MPVSTAKRIAIAKYRQEKRDQLAIDVPKGKRAEYKEKAASIGLSLAQLVQRAVEAYRADETTAERVGKIGTSTIGNDTGKIGTSNDQNASGEENPVIITHVDENAQNRQVSTNEQSIQPPAEPATERITGTKKKLIEAVNNLPPQAQKNLLNFLESLRT